MESMRGRLSMRKRHWGMIKRIDCTLGGYRWLWLDVHADIWSVHGEAFGVGWRDG